MKTWNRIFLLCLTGTVLLAAGMIFLPRYFSRKLDEVSLNQVHSWSDEQFSFLETKEGNLADTASIFQKMNTDNLILISSVTEPGKMNGELIEQVYEQAMTASELGMLPWIGSWGYELAMRFSIPAQPLQYWGDQVRYTRYYSLVYTSEEDANTKRLLNFWILRYSDGESYDYYFLVDATSYQIYYAEIYNSYTEYIYQYYENLYDKSEEYEIYADVKIADVKSAIVDSWSYDTASLLLDLFQNGCGSYYQAEDFRAIHPQGENERIALVSIIRPDATIYIEESLTEDPALKEYHGICVGFNKLGDKIHRVLN